MLQLSFAPARADLWDLYDLSAQVATSEQAFKSLSFGMWS